VKSTNKLRLKEELQKQILKLEQGVNTGFADEARIVVKGHATSAVHDMAEKHGVTIIERGVG